MTSESYVVFDEFAGRCFNLWRSEFPDQRNSNSCHCNTQGKRTRKVSLDDLLINYSDVYLESSLLLLPGDLQSSAMLVQRCIHKTIMKADPQNISVSKLKHLVKMHNLAITSHPAIKDEIYCQLVRLTNRPSSYRDAILCQQIMLTCLATFSPSEMLYPFLKSHLRACAVLSTEAPRRFTYLAEICLRKLDKIKTMGSRKFVPALTEIELIASQNYLALYVHFAEGRGVLCDEVHSWTTVSDLKNSVSRRIFISDDSYFSIVFRESTRNLEIVIPDHTSILEFLFQFCRSETNDPDKIFTVDIVYKVRLFVDQRLTHGGAKDLFAIHIFYCQMLHEYLRGNVRCRLIQDIVDLASLVLFAKFGRCPSDRNEAASMIVDSIHSIVPEDHLHEFDYMDCFYDRSNDCGEENSSRHCQVSVDQNDEYSTSNLCFTENATNSIILYPKESIECNSFSSGTWFLESVDHSSDWGPGWLCYKVRRAWNQIDMSFTSCHQAELAFLDRIRCSSSISAGARHYPVWVPENSPSARRWISQILKNTCPIFQSELRRIIGLKRTKSNVSRSVGTDECFFDPKNDSCATFSDFNGTFDVVSDLLKKISNQEKSPAEGLKMNLCVQDCKITLVMKLIDNIAFLENALDNFDHLEVLQHERSTQHDENLSNMTTPLEIKISSPRIHEGTEMTFVIPYKSMIAWGFSTDTFAIEYRVFQSPGEAVGERGYTTYIDEYFTHKGKEINNIITSYYGFSYK